jgi:hypothetical protein
LRQAIRQADLIVIGRLAGTPEAGSVGGFAVSRVTIEIEEILEGEPQTRREGSVVLQVLPLDTNETEGITPNERTLFFLAYVPALLERLGRPPEELQREKYDYVLVDGIIGPLREFDGVARALETRLPDYFPAMFEGESFEDVLTRIREAIANTR